MLGRKTKASTQERERGRKGGGRERERERELGRNTKASTQHKGTRIIRPRDVVEIGVSIVICATTSCHYGLMCNQIRLVSCARYLSI